MLFQSKRLAHQIGPRGAFLLCWAWVDSMYGLGMVNSPASIRASPTYAYPGTLLPLPIWGMAWLLVAALLIVSAFRRKDGSGFNAAIGLKLFWGLLMGGGWLTGDVPRGYVSMGWWVGAAMVIAVCARHLPVPPTGKD